MATRQVDRSIRSFNLPDLTGGLTSAQAQDNECQVFENVDISRDKWVATRAGTALAHQPGHINYQPIMGIANYGVGTGNLFVVAIKSGYGYYHKLLNGWNAGDRVTFKSFTIPYTLDTSESVSFEVMSAEVIV